MANGEKVTTIDNTSKHAKTHYGERRWWQYSRENVAGAVRNDVDRLTKSFSSYFRNYAINASTYYGGAVDGSYGSKRYGFTLKNTSLTDNVTESCVDALMSKMIKNFPTVSFQTEDGDYDLQTMAENLQDFVQGVFYSDGYRDKSAHKLCDSMVFGNGFSLWSLDGERIRSEVVHPFQLVMDYDETLSGPPEYIHVIKLHNKYLLAEKYPDFTDEIMASQYDSGLFWYMMNKNAYVDSDLCVIVESFSRCGKRHAICLGETCLLDEDWGMIGEDGKIAFPITNLSYKPSLGWMSQGMVQEVRSLQWEYDRVLRDIARLIYMGCVPKIIVGSQAKIPRVALNNEYLTIIPVSGSVDQIKPMTMASIPPDMIRHKMDLKDSIFSKTGVSQLTATNQLPPGVTAGTAIENLWQVDSDRYQMTAAGLESSVVEDCQMVIRLARWAYEAKGIDCQAVYFGDSRFSGRRIKFSDAPLDEGQYRLHIFPISMLPQTPTGRFELVDKMAQGGYANMSSVKKLLRLPDTDMFLDLETSEYDFVNRQISLMLKGTPQEPGDFQNLDGAADQIRKAFFYYTNRGAHDENVQLLSNYLMAIETLRNQKAKDQQLAMAQQQQELNQQLQQQGAINDGNKPSFDEPSGSAYNRRPTQQSVRVSADS